MQLNETNSKKHLNIEKVRIRFEILEKFQSFTVAQFYLVWKYNQKQFN